METSGKFRPPGGPKLESGTAKARSSSPRQRFESDCGNGDTCLEVKANPPPVAAVAPEAVARRVALVVATVLVDALAPLLQERASHGKNFDSSKMVLAETMFYCVGGLTVATMDGGVSGFQRAFRPARYVAFLPASAAFSTSNFLTYKAVRGLGASQFYLLAQLRVAVLAAFLRVWNGVRQPILAWLSLLQLATGMVVLCMYRASAGSGCLDAEGAGGSSAAVAVAAAAAAAASSPAQGSATAAAAQAAVEAAAAHAAEQAELIKAIVALIGVVVSSAFGFVYLEWQLKLHAQDPIFVQLHQMNFFGALASLCIFATHRAGAATASAGAAAVQVSTAAAAAATAAPALLRNASEALLDPALQFTTLPPEVADAGLAVGEVEGGLHMPSGASLAVVVCVVARGTLASTVLKRLDCIAKGLIDVTAIVLCTGLQFAQNELKIDGIVIGIQALMLLSICGYLFSRAEPAAVNGARPNPGGDLLEMSLRRLPENAQAAVQAIGAALPVAAAPAKRAV